MALGRHGVDFYFPRSAFLRLKWEFHRIMITLACLDAWASDTEG